MWKKLFIGAALLLTAGTSISHAVPPSWYRPPERYYEKVASDWVQLYLRRNATQREILQITNQLRSGVSPNEVQATILSSSEYYRKSGGNITNWAGWVISDVLGRQSTPQERGTLSQI